MQTLLDAIPHPVYYKDLMGNFLGTNDTFNTFFGFKKDEVLGRRVVEVAPIEVTKTVEETDLKLIDGKSKIAYEAGMKNAHGEHRDMIVTKALYHDAEGSRAGIVGVLLDTTEQKRNAAALQSSEEKNHQIMDNIGVGVVLVGMDFEILQMNRQMRDWFPEIDVNDRPLCYKALHDLSKEEPCSHCAPMLTLKNGQTNETFCKVSRFGQQCDFRIVASPIHDGEGNTVAAIMLLEDMTEKLIMERELMQSQKLASIGQLAAGVAHEINNPTGFVSSNLSTLGDYHGDLDKVIRAYQEMKDNYKTAAVKWPGILPVEEIGKVEKIENEIEITFLREDIIELIKESKDGTERIKKIVEDLKHFSHPGQDKVQDTDVNWGIETTLNIVNNELKYNATVVKELGELPIIMANPQQLNQVFANILVNAAHAIEKSGEIRITTRHVDSDIEITIRDTGCGIAAENLEKIFDPFFTTKDVGKGTGLGMNIAYNIIKKHNGNIKVESCVGVGTTFSILLPVELSDDEALKDGAVSEAVG